jgi:hypothetical protein
MVWQAWETVFRTGLLLRHKSHKTSIRTSDLGKRENGRIACPVTIEVFEGDNTDRPSRSPAKFVTLKQGFGLTNAWC